MPHHQYPQFCAIARAAEIIGERWTLLILRELVFGPKRFSDLRRGLSEVSPSILTERLGTLESLGIVKRTELEPPAASTVYELAENGVALQPVMMEIAKWGARFLFPPREGEQMDPGWVLNLLGLYSRRARVPSCRIALIVEHESGERVFEIHGGADGTEVLPSQADPDEQPAVTIRGSGPDVVAAVLGATVLDDAVADKTISIEGDESTLSLLPELFDMAAVGTNMSSKLNTADADTNE